MDPRLNASVTRVMIDPDEAVPPERAAAMGIHPDILFVRDDGWVLGAPARLAEAARRTYRDSWVAEVRLPSRVGTTYERVAAPLTKLHAAAKMLHADGTEAIRSAGELVGDDIARAMLVMYLTVALNPRPEVWPAPEDMPERVNKALREAGLLG